MRIILLPFSLLYSCILWLRHLCYDLGIFKSTGNFGVPVICIGNLNLGGTGKTPFTEYLIAQLSDSFKIGIISRGYGRKTSGYLRANPHSTVEEIGDEPYQIFHKYQNRISFAVSEDRTSGVQRLLQEEPSLQLIILDDAFQHRKIRADINILLTPYDQPYTEDLLLPAGNLRDIKSAAKRADLLVFTKAPAEATTTPEAQEVQSRWISNIQYDQFRNGLSGEPVLQPPKELLIVTGIAKPSYLIKHLEKSGSKAHQMSFPDHHKYTTADLDKIASGFDTFASPEKAVLTTEKDWVKLAPLADYHKDWTWIIAPIRFQLQREEDFLAELKQKIADASAVKK